MKRIKIIHVFAASALLLLNACKEEIQIDIPGEEPRVVIEAEVTTETDSSYVRITKTTDYYDNQPTPLVSNATVDVNGVPFTYQGNGIYKPASPFVGTVGTTYNLTVNHDGKTYTSTSYIEPMFTITSYFQTFKPKSGFIDEGWSVSYKGIDYRSRIKYTYFRLGYFDTIVQRDSFTSDKILFDNTQTPLGVEYSFELPFTRFKQGDDCLMIFRSVTKDMYDFIMAYSMQTSGAPGPFQVPPANLPYNIKGGAIGYFACYDVVRKRYTIQ